MPSFFKVKTAALVWGLMASAGRKIKETRLSGHISDPRVSWALPAGNLCTSHFILGTPREQSTYLPFYIPPFNP